MAPAMVDCWKLATIGMWVNQLESDGALKLICETFTWDELWEAATELNKQFAAKEVDRKIPKNKDQGDLKDRVKILGTAVISSLQELKNQADSPIFIVTSLSLAMVPGVVKTTVQAEPAVTSRLDNIETLSKGFNEMKNVRKDQWPALQVNGHPVQEGNGHLGVQAGGQPYGGARSKHDDRSLHAGGHGLRSRSESRKRKAEQEQQQQQHEQQQQQSQGGQQPGWNTVVSRNRKKQPVQYGTNNVRVAGGGCSL